MARLYVRKVPEQAVAQLPLEQMQLLAESKVSKGMVTVIDPADLDNAMMTLIKNGVVRFDKTGRRNGYIAFTANQPDSNPVMRLIHYKNVLGAEYIFRITPTSVFFTQDLTNWTPIPWVGLGGQSDRIDYAVAYDPSIDDYRVVFANNSKNKLQMISLASAPGSGATATANMSGGGVNTVTVNSGGSGYSSGSPPAVIFLGGNPQVPATATATVSVGGVITGVVVTSNGSGYTGTPSIMFASFEVTDLGPVAPNDKYVTFFNNRVISASGVSVNWSGDGNISEFNPNNDISAGSNPLVESPGDESDFITRVVGFTNVLVILRERSIWLATRQPIDNDPFYFYGAVPGIGCNCPYSVAIMPAGLCWADTVTGTVWHYSYAYNYGYVSGSTAPERIGLPVELTIMAGITDPTQVFGSYSALNNEYTICIPISGSNVTRMWTYNFRSKAWSYNEKPNVTEMNDVGLVGGYTSIEQLTGTIENLTGTIESLSTGMVISSTRLVGLANGSIQQDQNNPTVDTDPDGPYTTEIRSKDFWFPDIDTYAGEIRLEYIAQAEGQIELDYSKDSGQTWKTAKVINIDVLGVPQLMRYRKQIKSRRLMWRLVSTNGVWQILSYEVHVYPGAESRR